MKTALIIALSVLTALTLNGQDITGRWAGTLKVQAIQLKLVFTISRSDKGYASVMDSPDQGVKGIPVTSTTFEKPHLTLELPAAKISYAGELKDSSIVGTFQQAGQQFPLTLSRQSSSPKAAVRPQEPVKPYPYYSEAVTFANTKDQVSLAGTLTLPKRKANSRWLSS